MLIRACVSTYSCSCRELRKYESKDCIVWQSRRFVVISSHIWMKQDKNSCKQRKWSNIQY